MKDKRGQSFLLALAAVAVILVGVAFAFRHDIAASYRRWQQGPIPAAVTEQQFAVNANTPPAGNVNAAKPPVASRPPAGAPVAPKPSAGLPAQINLKVPFILQAPYQVWDAVHEDACEEASAAMVKGYLDGDTSYTAAQMEQKIQAIVDFENRTLGFNKDTTAEQTAAFMRDFLKIAGAKAVAITSITDVKKELAAGRPVILPAYGKALKNPNFRNGGPDYHMVVAKGYVQGKIITNDPGTRNGPDYVYDETLLWNAIHDYNGGDVAHGAKVMIAIK